MGTPVRTEEVALLRVVAQRLAGPRGDAVEAVAWMLCVQGQDRAGALTSVALRTQGRDRAAVVASLDAGEVVLTWPMRGTLHLVRADDVGWLLPLCAPRAVAASRARRAGLGLTDDDVDRAHDLAAQALAGGRHLDRAGLFAAWDAGGVPTTGQRGAHLVRHLAMAGLLCLGPVQGTHLVLLGEWVRGTRALDPEEALAELALRYYRSHGPATVADLARWAGLPVGQVRTGLAAAGDRLTSVDVDGTPHWLDPATPDLLAAHRREARSLHLLPGFDELMLGYGDRSAALPPEHADRIVPGGNGMFRPTVVHGGQVLGTWRSTGTGARRRVEATPFSAFPPAVERDLPRVAAALP